MLVLSRRVGERMFLPDIGVHVTVLSVKGGIVRMGIEAPDDILILRDELRDRGDSQRPFDAGVANRHLLKSK